MARALSRRSSTATAAFSLLMVALAGVSSSACTALDAATSCDDGSDRMCGETPGDSGGRLDSGVASDASPPNDQDGSDRDNDAGPSPPDAGGAAPEQAALCLDGADNDGDLAHDCADPGCAAASACCADNVACCGPASTVVALDFAACAADGPAGDCTAVRDIGAIRATVATRTSDSGDVRGLSVGGDLRADNGVVSPVDLTPDGTLALRADLHVLAADCAALGQCAESVTVGLTRQIPTTTVTPWIALTVSLDLHRAVLLVEGRVVASESFVPSDGSLSAQIDVAADGTVSATLSAGAVEIVAATGSVTSTPSSVYAAVWGRSANVPSARVLVGRVDVSHSTCDLPRAMRSGDAFTLQGGAPLGGAGSPSLAFDPLTGTRAGVVVIDGTVRGGRYDMTDGARTLEVDPAPWLTAPSGERVTSADLVYVSADSESPWWLFVSMESTVGGASRIAVVRAGVLGAFTADAVPIEVRPVDVPGDARVGGVDALARESDVLVVCTVAGDGGDDVLLTSVETASLSAAPSGVILQHGESSASLDHDGAGSPSLVAFRGLLHLFYAARRGTSTSIGYVYSTDGSYWRSYEGGPVISPADNVLSVSDPEATMLLDEGESPEQSGTLEIVYVTNDGARRGLALARRRVFLGATE